MRADRNKKYERDNQHVEVSTDNFAFSQHQSYLILGLPVYHETIMIGGE